MLFERDNTTVTRSVSRTGWWSWTEGPLYVGFFLRDQQEKYGEQCIFDGLFSFGHLVNISSIFTVWAVFPPTPEGQVWVFSWAMLHQVCRLLSNSDALVQLVNNNVYWQLLKVGKSLLGVFLTLNSFICKCKWSDSSVTEPEQQRSSYTERDNKTELRIQIIIVNVSVRNVKGKKSCFNTLFNFSALIFRAGDCQVFLHHSNLNWQQRLTRYSCNVSTGGVQICKNKGFCSTYVGKQRLNWTVIWSRKV